MKLTKAGQFVNVDTGEVENLLDFDSGSFSLVITDEQYQQVLNFLQGAKRSVKRQAERFYVDSTEVQTAKSGQEEDGIEQL